MLHKALFVAWIALLALLASSSPAQAWGGAHVGYTHVGPNGVYHAGATTAYGGAGGYRYGGETRYGGDYRYGAGGGYRYGAGGGYRYGDAYHYGGYSYGSYGNVRAGYVRSW